MEIVCEYLGHGSDKAIWSYFREHWRHFFPKIGCRTSFSRQCANLNEVTKKFCEFLFKVLSADQDLYLSDGFPIPTCHIKRYEGSKTELRSYGSVGYCAAKDEKYFGFKKLKTMLESNNDTLIYEEKGIEKIIKENKPKKIIIYNNRADSTHNNHILPLNNFINQNKLESYFDIHLFDWNGHIPEGKTHHHIQFPNNKKHIEILKLHFLQ